MPDTDPAASALDEIRANANGAITDSGEGCTDVRVSCLGHNTLRAAAAVEAALKLADGARVAMSACGVSGPCSCGRHPVAWTLDPAKLRAAITTALAGKEAGDER